MRVAIIGQQAFGKAALDAFIARGDTVAAVFCAPEKGRPDPLRLAAEAAGIPAHAFPRLSAPEALQALRDANADIGVMAFVTQFVSQAFCGVPRHGMIQFHPSLLPLHRGASSLSWAIMLGRSETGFSIFRPIDGLDEGPVLLQRTVAIGPDDTLGGVYFERVFPEGVKALLETADLVVGGGAAERSQDESQAGYEGIVGEAESRIDWAAHIDITYNKVRACNPAPGAWTEHGGKRLTIFDCRKRPARTFAAVKGRKPGEIVAVEDAGVVVHGQGGFLVVERVRRDGGAKMAAAEAGLEAGMVLG